MVWIFLVINNPIIEFLHGFYWKYLITTKYIMYYILGILKVFLFYKNIDSKVNSEFFLIV